MKKALIIDCQIFQSSTYFRGIGRYSLKLLENILPLLKEKGFSNILFLLNKDISTSNDLSVLKKLKAEFIFINLGKNPKANLTNEKQKIRLIDRYISQELSEFDVFFLMLSNFEINNSFSVFPTETTNLLLFYDLIPHLFQDFYLRTSEFADEYYFRFRNIFKAHQIFSISETTKNDLITFLNINANKIINIAGASIISVDSPRKKINKFKNYILLPTGNEYRKNNRYAIKCFESLLDDEKFEDVELVLTSNFDSDTSNQLLNDINDSVAKRIHFAGNVSDNDLSILYSEARLIFFPSLYEGLGLPVLEAMTYSKPIVASNISVFREFQDKNLIFCDSKDVRSGVKALKLQLKKSTAIDYSKTLLNFTWTNSATQFIKNLIPAVNQTHNRKKVAILTPNPEGYSAIGKVTQNLAAYLSDFVDVTLFIEDGDRNVEIRKSFAKYCWPTKYLYETNINELNSFDRIIIQMGNSAFHRLSYLWASIISSKLILHDTNLQGLINCMSDENAEFENRIKLEKDYSKVLRINKISYPSILEKASQVVAHSIFARKQLLSYKSKCIIAGLPVPGFINTFKNKSKKLKVGFAGIIADAKGLSLLEKLIYKFDDIEFIIFGFQLGKLPNFLGTDISQNVKLYVNPTDFEFNNCLEEIDLLLSFRETTNGESSLSTLEAMRVGVPPIVNNIGWFSEIPDNSCFKVTSHDDVISMFSDLLSLRRIIDEKIPNCKKFIESYHSFNDYSKFLIK